jgi:hypothetical protein
MYPEELKTETQTNTCILLMFIAALFITAKVENNVNIHQQMELKKKNCDRCNYSIV